ncbi:kinase-like domain-containing protein [Mycena capillaripes]|nr:kinase-like domain-containing protein [Mycena capillaripes]
MATEKGFPDVGYNYNMGRYWVILTEFPKGPGGKFPFPLFASVSSILPMKVAPNSQTPTTGLPLRVPYDEPFGSWPKDFHWEPIAPPGKMETLLSLGHIGRVDLFQAHGVVTKKYNPSRVDLARLCNIMDTAGDCSVSLVGRLFECGSVVGFCMPIETPVDPENLGGKDERICIIYQLRDLVTELHKKQIVHGDIKPQNLLICSDGRVRLCDFDNAPIEGDGFVCADVTYPYCSTFRARNEHKPMTRAEDMYAMGLTMWHIYTGRIPLLYDGELEDDFPLIQGYVMDRTFAGFLPDMQLIDDPQVASLIQMCLAAGPDRPDVWDSGQCVYCIETHFVFGRCKAEPTHTYSRIIHAPLCVRGINQSNGPCIKLFVDPKVFTTSVEPICTKCNIGVEYIGLAG